MKTLILLSSLFLVSCGNPLNDHRSDEGSRKFNTTNPVFRTYIQDFETEASVELRRNYKIGNIPINFNTMEDRYAGICWTYGSKKEITINKKHWENYSEASRRVLIFHELGHCALGRGHNNETYNGFHLSVMNWQVISGFIYSKYQSAYDIELFRRDTSKLKEVLR